MEKTRSGARASASVEARIRKRARPLLSRDERRKLALIKAIDDAELAEGRCREAAAQQEARAERWKDRRVFLELELQEVEARIAGQQEGGA